MNSECSDGVEVLVVSSRGGELNSLEFLLFLWYFVWILEFSSSEFSEDDDLACFKLVFSGDFFRFLVSVEFSGFESEIFISPHMLHFADFG